MATPPPRRGRQSRDPTGTGVIPRGQRCKEKRSSTKGVYRDGHRVPRKFRKSNTEKRAAGKAVQVDKETLGSATREKRVERNTEQGEEKSGSREGYWCAQRGFLPI